MRVLDTIRRFFRWRWFPCVLPVLLALVYVLLAVWLVPESFTPGEDEDESDPSGDAAPAKTGAQKGTTSGSVSTKGTAVSRVRRSRLSRQRASAKPDDQDGSENPADEAESPEREPAGPDNAQEDPGAAADESE